MKSLSVTAATKINRTTESPDAEVLTNGVVEIESRELTSATAEPDLQRLASVSKVKATNGVLSDKEILERAQVAMYKVSDKLAERLNLDKDELRALLPKIEIMGNDDTYAGFYEPAKHVIKINPKFVRLGRFTVEGIASHETNHALEIILRTQLGKAVAKNISLSQVCSHVVNGATGYLSSATGFTEPLPIPTIELRREIARFICEVVNKPESSGYSETLSLQMAEDVVEYKRLNNEGLCELASRLQNINGYDKLLGYFDGNKETAGLMLKSFADAHLYRFYFANGSFKSLGFNSLTLKDGILPQGIKLSDQARQFAVASAKGFLDYFEGNFKLGIAHATNNLEKDLYLSYTFAPEEVRSQQVEIEVERSLATSQTTIDRLKAKQEVYELGQELMDLKRKIDIAPKDSEKCKQHLAFHVVSAMSQNCEGEIGLVFVGILNHLYQQGKITKDQSAKSQEQIALGEAITEYQKLDIELGKSFANLNYPADKFERVVDRRLQAMREVGTIALSLCPELKENVERLEGLLEVRRELFLKFRTELVQYNKTFTAGAKEIELLDKSCPENISLIQKVGLVEAEMVKRLPEADINSLHPDFFKSLGINNQSP